MSDQLQEYEKPSILAQHKGTGILQLYKRMSGNSHESSSKPQKARIDQSPLFELIFISPIDLLIQMKAPETRRGKNRMKKKKINLYSAIVKHDKLIILPHWSIAKNKRLDVLYLDSRFIGLIVYILKSLNVARIGDSV